MVISIILNIAFALFFVFYFIIKADSEKIDQKELQSQLISLKNKAYKVKTFRQLYDVTREFTQVLISPTNKNNIALYNELKAYLDMRHKDMLDSEKEEENIDENFVIS